MSPVGLGDVVAAQRHVHVHVVWRVLGGMLGFASFFFVTVSRVLSRSGNSEADAMLLVALAFLSPVLLGAVAISLLHRRDRIEVRALGLEQRIGGRVVAFRFDDVVASRTHLRRDASPASIDVRLRDGTTVVVRPPSHGLATTALLRALSDRHTMRAKEAFDAGRALRYGDLELDPMRGVSRGGDLLSWSNLADVSVTAELIVLAARAHEGRTKDWTVISPDTLEDLDGLVTALGIARERARSGK